MVAVGVACAASDRFFVEAGAERLWLSKITWGPEAHILIAPPNSIQFATRNEDRRVWAPRAAVGYRFTEPFSVRVAYAQTRAEWDRSTYEVVGGDAWVELLRTHFEQRIRIATIAPEYRLKLSRTLEAAVSPQLNWVEARETAQVTWTQPYITVVPYSAGRSSRWTLGAAASVSWRLTDAVQLFVDYTYLDLKPARGRTANAFGGGLLLGW